MVTMFNFNFHFPKGGWGFVAGLFLICLLLFWLDKSASALSIIFLSGVVLAGYNLSYDAHDIIWWIVLGVCFLFLIIFGVVLAPSEWQTIIPKLRD